MDSIVIMGADGIDGAVFDLEECVREDVHEIRINCNHIYQYHHYEKLLLCKTSVCTEVCTEAPEH